MKILPDENLPRKLLVALRVGRHKVESVHVAALGVRKLYELDYFRIADDPDIIRAA